MDIVTDKVNLMFGDCLERMKEIESGIVDAIICDLPYGTVKGVGDGDSIDHGMKGKTGWDSVISTDKIMQESNRILRKNGKMVLFAQQPFTTELINGAIPNLPFNYSLTWEKDHFANSLIAKKAPVNYTEDILVFSKYNPKNEVLSTDLVRNYFVAERKKINASLSEINRIAFGDKSGKDGMAGNILSAYKKGWTFPTRDKYKKLNLAYGVCNADYDTLKMEGDKIRLEYITEESIMYPNVFNLWDGKKYKSNILKYKKDYDGYHPTQKPVLLLEDLIRTYSNKGNLVVDFTMGSGSTGVACVNTGRKFIGIELDPTYYGISCARILEAGGI